MARGFFRGLIVGAVTGAIGFGTWSLTQPLPGGPDVVALDPSAPVAGEGLPSSLTAPVQGRDAKLLDVEPSAPTTAPTPASAPVDIPQAPEPMSSPSDAASPAQPTALAPSAPALPDISAGDDAPGPIGRPALPDAPRSAGAISAPQVPVVTLLPVRPNPLSAGSGPPLEAFAAPVTAPPGKPLMSVVLLDGSGEAGLGEVQALDLPVSVVLDAEADNATTRLARVRDAGFETLISTDLGSADLAGLRDMLDALPETVAVYDVGAADQSSARLQEVLSGGRGVIGEVGPIDGAVVPVFRDLDAAGQSAATIMRFLDQAAFRAEPETPIVVLGRMQGDTLEALANWRDSARANEVALVPVSAILRAQR